MFLGLAVTQQERGIEPRRTAHARASTHTHARTHARASTRTHARTPQVVIRVRPPLPRELQGYTSYQCTSLVDARSGQLITISENLPAVLSGQGAADGMLYATYRRVLGCRCGVCV
jgi:hypothetical protein